MANSSNHGDVRVSLRKGFSVTLITNSVFCFSPLTLTLSPLRGEGTGNGRLRLLTGDLDSTDTKIFMC
jgi:hypothetical protein